MTAMTKNQDGGHGNYIPSVIILYSARKSLEGEVFIPHLPGRLLRLGGHHHGMKVLYRTKELEEKQARRSDPPLRPHGHGFYFSHVLCNLQNESGNLSKDTRNHSTTVVDNLKNRLMSATNEFKEVLTMRTENLKVLENRRQMFSSSAAKDASNPFICQRPLVPREASNAAPQHNGAVTLQLLCCFREEGCAPGAAAPIPAPSSSAVDLSPPPLIPSPLRRAWQERQGLRRECQDGGEKWRTELATHDPKGPSLLHPLT